MGTLSKEYDLQIEWKLVEIHPETPREGASWDIYPEWYLEDTVGLSIKAAEEHGIDLKQPCKIFNSRIALQAAEYAKDIGKFDNFHDALFKSIFVHDADVGDWKVVSDIAASCAINVGELKEKLEEGRLMRRLDKNLVEFMARGINVIPTTFVGWQRINGAVPLVAFRQAINNVIEELKTWNEESAEEGAGGGDTGSDEIG
jgi:predicted DsbA family dithiol-disulfide isomerase